LDLGILFHGPTGTGKTLLAKTIATELTSKGFPIGLIIKNGSELHAKYFGETEQNIKRLFQDAHENQPTLIFLDELDALCPPRDGKSGKHFSKFFIQLYGLGKMRI